MTAEQLIIGNKYVPFQKTAGESFEDSFFIRNNYVFLYYRGTDPSSGRHTFGGSERGSGGGFYNPGDVYEYIEEHNGIRRGMAVTIINDGYTFSTYADMFEQLRFANKRRNDAWDNDTEGVVFAISKVPDGRVVFAVRHSSGKECLIEAAGVRLVDDVVDCLPTKWFIEINELNKADLKEWRGFNITQDYGYLLSDIPEGKSHSLPNNCGYYVRTLEEYPEYRLITDEQFYNQVINKPMPQITQETLPETPQDAPQDAPQETKQYPKTPEGLYQMTVDLLAFEVGDTVRVTHKVPSHYNGWQNNWSDSMDVFIGREYKIEGIFETGFQLEYTDSYKFPIYSLELVKRKETLSTHTLCFTGASGSMEDGGEFVHFNSPITKLSGNDVYWLVQLLIMAGVDKKYSVSTKI